MPDNYPHEFDEQFVSQAWADMKALLDKEMPVAGKRRAAGWWPGLLLGLALLFFLAGGICYWHEAHKPETQPTATAGIAEVSKNTPSSQQDQAKAPEGQIESAGSAEGPSTSGIAAEPQAKKPSTAVFLRKERTPLSGNNTDAATAIAGQKEKNVPKAEINRIGEQTQAKVPGAAGNEEAIPPREKMAKLSTISVLLGELENTSLKESLPAAEATLPPLFRFAAEAGIFTAGQAPAEGFGLGLSGALHFRNSPWRLRAGLFYRHYSQSMENGEKVHSLQNSAFKIPQQGEFVPRTSYLWASNEITSTHYIGLPLQAGFRLFPRLSVEAGLEASLLLAARESTSWSVSGENSSPGGVTAEREAIYQSEDKAPGQALNRANLSLIGGLLYQPGPRIGLRLSYQHGLANLLASPGFEAYQRGLWFNVGYSLKR